MKARKIRNVPASIHARLLRLAHERGEEFQRVLVRFALERLLYRLSRSPHWERFALKGAMLFQVWEEDLQRMTRDLDLLGLGPASDEAILETFRDLFDTTPAEDGLDFRTTSLRAEPIREHTAYVGLRVKGIAHLGTARIPLQIDVGVGDAVVSLEEIDYPTLLDLPAPRVLAYPKELVVAEKAEAILKLGLDNTRMKDYFDLHRIAGSSRFKGKSLRTTMAATLSRRGTPVPDGGFPGLSSEFGHDRAKQTQWAAFLRRIGQTADGLPEVVSSLASFLGPILAALRDGDALDQVWEPGGPWTG